MFFFVFFLKKKMCRLDNPSWFTVYFFLFEKRLEFEEIGRNNLMPHSLRGLKAVKIKMLHTYITFF